MSADVPLTATVAPGEPAANALTPQAAAAAPRRVPSAPLSEDSQLAVEIRTLVEAGDLESARERFEGLVAAHQRRAVRIAYQYLRDAAEADEAVQDAFVKVFSHIGSYREAWPFEVWFTRILINGCLDRRKARVRRDRWIVPADDSATSAGPDRRLPAAHHSAHSTSPIDPEARLLARERRARMTAAVDRLEG